MLITDRASFVFCSCLPVTCTFSGSKWLVFFSTYVCTIDFAFLSHMCSDWFLARDYDCRGITEARLVYLAVIILVCFAMFPFGQDHLSEVRRSQLGSSSHAENTLDTAYKELKQATVDAGTTWVVPFWRHMHIAWLLLMLLLARPHNIVLIAIILVQNICCLHVVTHLRRTEDCVSPASLTLLYMFSGQAAFFYQVTLQFWCI